MTNTREFDSITAAELRAAGSVKWSAYPGCIGAFIAEMDFGTAPAIGAALRRYVDTASFGYLPMALTEQLAELTSAWYARQFGWSVPADRVRLIPDGLSGLRIAIEEFTTPGSPVIVPTPAYMPFLTLPADLGREIITVPALPSVHGPTLDLAGIEAALTAGAELVVLCNPWNPTGRVLEATELAALADVVNRCHGKVLADEIHAPLVYSGQTHVPYAAMPGAGDHTVTLTSAAKAWNLPGLKCGQLLLSESDLATWTERSLSTRYAAAVPGVVATIAAYSEGGPWLEQIVTYLDRNRLALAELLAEHAPAIGYTPPQGTYLAWLDCTALKLPMPAAEFFRDRAQVATQDGSACGAGADWVRFNFALPYPLLVQAIEQMGAAIRQAA